jgi:photosystem II stability/assembly factor-like uncharacterized protein
MKFLFFIFIIFQSAAIRSQEFIFKLMERNDLKFSETEAIAKHYFDSAGTGRETGYIHYQRWRFERKFHLDANGYFVDPKTEWETWKQTTPLTDATNAITWTELGPWGWSYTSGWNPGTGRLTDVAIHPSDTTIIYVTSPGGGIWKSTNSGNTWAPLQDFNSTWMNMYAVTIDPSNINTIYAGNASGNIEKSINGGSTWTTLGAGPSGTVRKIIVHPSNSNIIFVGSTSGIHRSVNGGTTFTQVYSTQIEDIEFKPDNVNIMIATGSSTVVRSTDNGVTWSVLGVPEGITNTGRSLVAVTPADPNVVYIVQASGSSFGRLYRSADAGISFTTMVVGNYLSGTNYFGYTGSTSGGQATYDMAMCVSPTDANDVYIAGICVWRSTNGGTSFTVQTVWSYPNGTGYNHADVHGLRWVNKTIYSNSDGAIFKSMDNADNWTNISTGLGIRQFYRIASSQTDPNVITGGAQDNGSVTRKPAGNWVDWLGADGMEGLVSPTNVNNLWGTSQNGAIYRSTNGGNSYSNLSQPSTGNWISPLAIDPTNETILYGGWTGFYKSTNSGVNWTLLSGATITLSLDDIAIAPSNSNYLYASRGTLFYYSTDAGATWLSSTPGGTISDICVHRTIPSKVYISTTAASNQLMLSTNSGASFTAIATGLPAVAARSVAIENNAVQGLYVGMNTGVYYKNDTMSAWLNFTGNLPAVAVNEVEIQYAAQKLRLATYGRGVWEAPLFVPNAVLPVRFLNISAKRNNDNILVSWSVANESHHTAYILQRSNDGIVFNDITRINGTGQPVAEYRFTDININSKIVYYRVKETEGTNNIFSNVVSIRLDEKTPAIQILPNPVHNGSLHYGFVNNNAQNYEINILTTDGRIVLVHRSGAGIGDLYIGNLQNGLYKMVIKQNKEIYQTTFVKDN